jgi:16S rRNA (adenine1518-N6/adenine1519-N6)-dimethyltransferase
MPQRLGQHFLRKPWRDRIFAHLPIQPEQCWLEIGAGHGEMTLELARRAQRVVAIEKDPRLAARLRELQSQASNLEVVAGDILEQDLTALAGRARLHVYGNLPYYITGPILRHLFAHSEALADIYVVVQLEVAARLMASAGRRDYGFLTVLARYYTTPEFLLRLPPGAFQPPPKVASALVRLQPPGARVRLHIEDEAKFIEFLGRCFGQKRKTLLNNLRSITGRSRAEQILAAAGLKSSTRAEALAIEQFASLFQLLHPEKER